MQERPSRDEYYLNIALDVAKRATCLRRRFGAVIVNHDEIVSTGYTGAPRGAKNCIDLGDCPREKAGVPPGERYELCRSVHAEANAIISASRKEMLGGTMYLAGENVKDGTIATAQPCKMCKRLIINAGIEKVVVRAPNNFKKFLSGDWLNETIDFTSENIKGY